MIPADSSIQQPDVPDALARIAAALPDLADRLRAAELPLSPDRWQNLLDLLLVLAEQRRLPDDPAGLAPLIGPLFCRSEREQQQFQRIFAAWVEAIAPAADDPMRSQDKTRTAVADRSEPPPIPRLRWWLLGLALLLAATVGGFYGYNRLFPPAEIEVPDPPATPPEQPPPAALPEPEPELEPEPEPMAPSGEAAVVATPEQDFQPIPPRRLRLDPSGEPILDPIYQSYFLTLGQLCLILPAFFALFWLLLGWLSWQTVLERRRGRDDDPFVGIALPAGTDDLLDAPALRAALKRLHTPVALPTRQLDVDRTVARTARNAGLFTPARRQRREVPELVVLVELHHAGDQMAGLAGQLVQRLREAGLGVQRYDYRDSPRRCIGADGRWRGLAEIAARHAGARLLIVGEPAALLDPHLSEPQRWTRALWPWPRRALLSTRRPPHAWEQMLDAAGFAVAEISSAGIRTLALHLGGLRAADAETAAASHGTRTDGAGLDAGPAARPASLPRLLQDQGQWSQPVAPDQARQQALLRGLDDYLGADGAELLAAMAAYPQLHWGLTRLLDLNLFPDTHATGREQRLLRIARLPWSRLGWLPDWLRTALLDRLPRRQQRRLRALYKGLLGGATTQGPGRIALPVGLPEQRGLLAGLIGRAGYWFSHKGWRLDRWLRACRDLSPDHGVLNDAIFADILFGWRLPLARFVVPRRLLRRYLGGALGQALAPRLLLALILALGGAWLADQAWHGWLRHQARPWLVQQQHRGHGEYPITIWHRPEAARLAEALRQRLEQDGFTQARIAEERLVLPEDTQAPDQWTNRIQFADAAGKKMARHIEGWLSHLAWGQAPQIAKELGVWGALPAFAEPPGPNALRVLLATGGSAGTGFRDALIHELTAEELQALVPPSPSSQVEPGVDPPGTPPDSQQNDPQQNIPGQGPEPDLTADAAADAPARSAEEPADVQRLLREIADLEQQLQTLRNELTLELTGADGRPAGRGPLARRLEREIENVQIRLREAQNRLGSAQLDQLRATGKAFRDPLKDGGEGPEMVVVPAGCFQMGSPASETGRDDDERQHRVCLSRAFGIGTTEVTFADYDRFARATGRALPDDEGWGRDRRPVINVSWQDATAYAEWLSDQTGAEYRLPSEAEWEYAARAGTTTAYWWGDKPRRDRANYGKDDSYVGHAEGADRWKYTAPVGSFPANAFGLHDTAGNVWEWVEDWYDDYPSGEVSDPVVRQGGSHRVLRGGSWLSYPRYLRSADRSNWLPGYRLLNLGFRLARTF